MTIPLRILPGDRILDVLPGTTILKAAHAAGIDITATCGGRGRCTSCRVKFLQGTIPPPTIMDELQLGADLVREGYRLSCQCAVTESISVQPMTMATTPSWSPVSLASGLIVATTSSSVTTMSLRAAGMWLTGDGPGDGGTTRVGDGEGWLGEVTVTTFGPAVIGIERGDTALMKFGLAIDVGTTSVVSTLIELESGEQLASVSGLNPQAVFGGDLMSRIAFAQFNPANLRKLQTRIIGLLNQTFPT